MILARCLKDHTKPITVEIETKSGARDVERAHFGLYLVLSDIQGHIGKAAEKRDLKAVWDLMRRYFELATGLEVDCVGTFVQFARNLILLWALNNLFIPPPFLKGPLDHVKSKKALPWDYEGREVFLMVHMLARAYGWDIDTIVNLEPEVGLMLVNEILVDEQLQQEWDYGLSDVARVYNPATKTTHFQPLPRPAWMSVRTDTLKTRIPLSAMPVGVVLDVEGKKIN